MTRDQIKQIQGAIITEDGPMDYKDVNCAIQDAILAVLEPTDPILQNMPDALDCPRAFSEWWSKQITLNMLDRECLDCSVTVERTTTSMGQDDEYNNMVLAHYECPKCGKTDSILEQE